MVNFILKKLLSTLITIFFVSIVVFIIIELPPGDFTDSFAAGRSDQGEVVSKAEIENMRALYGLDRPVHERYFKWIWGIVSRGDFGISFRYKSPVLFVIGERISFTTYLALLTMLFTYLIAIPIGIYSAMRQYTLGDYFFTFAGYLGLSIPSFLLALLLLYFSTKYTHTTVGGLFSPEFKNAAWSMAKVVDMLKHIWVAAVVLAVAGTAKVIRTLRATLLDEKSKLYVTAAKARGVSGNALIMKYPVRAAMNPIAEIPGQSCNEPHCQYPWLGTFLCNFRFPYCSSCTLYPRHGAAISYSPLKPGYVPCRNAAYLYELDDHYRNIYF